MKIVMNANSSCIAVNAKKDLIYKKKEIASKDVNSNIVLTAQMNAV